MHTRFEKMSERLEMLRDLSQKKKEESFLEEIGTDPKISGEWLGKVAYDPKSLHTK